jgi:hypothetical protein
VTSLYRVYFAQWRKLGSVYPPIRAMAGFDNMLFGVRDAGTNKTANLDLYCRIASNFDFTWTRIGTAPPGTYALAAYYGRLYALAATTTANETKLYWRSAIADAGLPFRAPSMLFLNGATFAIGWLRESGDFVTTGSGTLDFSYTHATRANDGLCFFYNQSNGAGVVVRFQADGSFTKVKQYASGSFGTWHLIVYVRCGNRNWADYSDANLVPMKEKILFYNNNGATSVGTFDTQGVYTQAASPLFTANCSHVLCTYAGDVLLYRSSTGACSWGRFSDAGAYTQTASGALGIGYEQLVPAGHTYLFIYKSAASGSPATNAYINPLRSTLTNVSSFNIGPSRMLASCENGLVLDYLSGNGEAKTYGFAADPSATVDPYVYDTADRHGVQLRAYPAGSFAGGWQKIVGLGIL